MKTRKHISTKQHVKAIIASIALSGFYAANYFELKPLAALLLGLSLLWILYFLHDVVSNQATSQD